MLKRKIPPVPNSWRIHTRMSVPHTKQRFVGGMVLRASKTRAPLDSFRIRKDAISYTLRTRPRWCESTIIPFLALMPNNKVRYYRWKRRRCCIWFTTNISPRRSVLGPFFFRLPLPRIFGAVSLVWYEICPCLPSIVLKKLHRSSRYFTITCRAAGLSSRFGVVRIYAGQTSRSVTA